MNGLMPGILRLNEGGLWSTAFILYYRQNDADWADLTHYIEQDKVELSRSLHLEEHLV